MAQGVTDPGSEAVPSLLYFVNSVFLARSLLLHPSAVTGNTGAGWGPTAPRDPPGGKPSSCGSPHQQDPPPPSAWARAGLQQCPRGAPRGAPSGPHSVRGHGGAGHRRASLGISLPAGSHRRAAAVAAGRGGGRAAVPPGAGRTHHWCFLPTGRLAGVAGKKKAGQRRQR